MKLKPCPFCGTNVAKLTNEAEAYFGEGVGLYRIVVCDAEKDGCGASTGCYGLDKVAAERWNQRADKE